MLDFDLAEMYGVETRVFKTVGKVQYKTLWRWWLYAWSYKGRTFKITNCDLEQRAWMIIHSEGEDLHPFLFEFANCEANQQSREYPNIRPMENNHKNSDTNAYSLILLVYLQYDCNTTNKNKLITAEISTRGIVLCLLVKSKWNILLPAETLP